VYRRHIAAQNLDSKKMTSSCEMSTVGWPYTITGLLFHVNSIGRFYTAFESTIQIDGEATKLHG
jgi:hypothetical protein